MQSKSDNNGLFEMHITYRIFLNQFGHFAAQTKYKYIYPS